MKYEDHRTNHVIISRREGNLEEFLDTEFKGMKHKRKHSVSSHSEDALTWSCFDVLRHLSYDAKITALDEILRDSFEGNPDFSFAEKNYSNKDIKIEIGKHYTGRTTQEETELDASIETSDKLIFFEAKLYCALSLADPVAGRPHDQIAKKLRVGLDYCGKRDFYFIFLDLAPCKKLFRRKHKAKAENPSKSGYHEKWKSAWWFSYYKRGHNGSLSPLKKVLHGIPVESVQTVADRMGWLTWSDLYKTILRGLIATTGFTASIDSPGN